MFVGSRSKMLRLRTMRERVILCFALMLLIISRSAAADCQMDNAALQEMSAVTVSVERADGTGFSFPALFAGDVRTRSAGFQYVCAERIAQTPILFHFGVPVSPSFHMNNVVAPIDIAFIDARGKIESVQSMAVYQEGRRKPRYSPSRPIVAALEVSPGFYAENRIDLKSRISWSHTRPTPESE